MLVKTKGYLIDEKSGEFSNDNGEQIKYHNARFYDVDNNQLFKVRVDEVLDFPEPAVVSEIYLDLSLGEKSHRVTYAGYKPLSTSAK